MRFCDLQNPTAVPCGAVQILVSESRTVRYGADFVFRLSFGVVWCGAVRCGAVRCG